MARELCAYHPAVPASWHCPSCGSLLCQDCFPAQPDSVKPPYCTFCGGNMRYLGAANSSPPFWMQMHKFFAYPLQLNGLIFLALIAALTAGTIQVFDMQSLFVFLPVFIIVSLVIRQGLRVIEFCSQGKTKAPDLLDLFDGNPTTIKMLGLMIAFGVASGLLATFGMLGVLAILGLSALLPASIMLLAVTGSLFEALNPAEIWRVASRTGWSYLGLVMVLALISAGPDQLLQMLPQATLQKMLTQSPHVFFALIAVSTTYFNMVMGAMMGYLLYQHHADLGIETEEPHAAEPTDKRKLGLARAALLLRESRFEDAIRELGGLVTDYPDDADAHGRYHRLLCESDLYPERIAQHTDRYMEFLVRTGRDNRLTGAFEAARQRQPDYLPRQISLRTRLANEYFRQRKYKAAIALLAMLHKEAPQSEDLPEAYYLLARVYSEGLRDDDKALMVLDYVLSRFPDHALNGQIGNYRSVLQAMKENTPAKVQ